MKTYLHAFAMCQSMFCAILAPQVWDEKARDKMLLFLPIVGLEIGAIWAGLAWLCRLLNLPSMITALVLSAYPYIVTGFLFCAPDLGRISPHRSHPCSHPNEEIR